MHPIVRSPGTGKFRKGYGFSIEEIKKANLTVGEAKKIGIQIDKRRRTSYDENVKKILEIVEEYKAIQIQKPKKEKTPIDQLPSISKTHLEKLKAEGIESIEMLATLDPEVLSKTIRIRKPTAEKLVRAAREFIKNKKA